VAGGEARPPDVGAVESDGSSSRRRVGPTETVAAAVLCNPCITRRAWISLLPCCWPRGRSPELLIPLLVPLAGLSITACLSSNPQALPKICTLSISFMVTVAYCGRGREHRESMRVSGITSGRELEENRATPICLHHCSCVGCFSVDAKWP
jgi:hypothetical protein